MEIKKKMKKDETNILLIKNMKHYWKHLYFTVILKGITNELCLIIIKLIYKTKI